MTLRQRVKRKPVHIKCDREKRKAMLPSGRVTTVLIHTPLREGFVWEIVDCYWSEKK